MVKHCRVSNSRAQLLPLDLKRQKLLGGASDGSGSLQYGAQSQLPAATQEGCQGSK